jgi:hypothetical protein
MTAAQKAAREKFKKVVAEAGKLRKKNPKLTQAQAVKQAWAMSYSKAGKTKKVGAIKKKAAPKKAATKKSAPKKSMLNGIKQKFIFDIYKRNEYGDHIPSSKKSVSIVRSNSVSAKDFLYKKYPSSKYFIELESIERIGAVKKKLAPKKKAAPKKVPGSHKDTKSHNVNIRVMSGIDKVKNDSINKYKEVLKDIKYYEDAIKRIKDSLPGLISSEKIRAKLVIKNFTKIKNELKIHSKEIKKLI